MDWLRQIASRLAEIGFSGFCDMAIVALAIYSVLVGLKRTRRSALIFAGIAILGAVYVLARKFDLVLTVALLQGFFTVFLVALIVIFQEDLRYLFERLALWWIERRLPLANRQPRRLPRREVEVLARTLGDLARARVGALVVVRGRDSIARHLEGGEDVQGLLSESLVKSIFDPHSLGHDGAVIVDGNRIEKLACHLPLSKNLEKLPRSGTRHAAALGLSELSDALCLVVSEERGTISVARHGDLRRVADPSELVGILEAFYADIAPAPEPRPGLDFLRQNSREKVIALAASVALWLLVVHRSQIIQRTYDVPVQCSQLPSQLMVTNLAPGTVRATFSGPRKAYDFIRADDFKLVLKLWDARSGERHVTLSSMDLAHPAGLELEYLDPRQVTLQIGEKTPPPKPPSATP